MLQLLECFEHPRFKVQESTSSWVTVVMVWVIWAASKCFPNTQSAAGQTELGLSSKTRSIPKPETRTAGHAATGFGWGKGPQPARICNSEFARIERIKLYLSSVFYFHSYDLPRDSTVCKILGAHCAVQMDVYILEPNPLADTLEAVRADTRTMKKILGPEFRALRVQARGQYTQSQVQPARTQGSANCFNRCISNEWFRHYTVQAQQRSRHQRIEKLGHWLLVPTNPYCRSSTL